jgi:hypothetical protein
MTGMYSAAIAEAAGAIIDAHGGDVHHSFLLRRLAKQFAQQTGCHADTAKRILMP